MSHWIDAAIEEMEAMTPKTGFNVVGVDRFAPPGEALYLIKHTEDKAEADRIAAEHRTRSGNQAHVYEAKKSA